MGDINLSDIAALLNNRDNGIGGGDGALWLIIILVLFGGWGGWGSNRAANGNVGGNELYPWLNQMGQVNDGFQNQMLGTTGGFSDVLQSLCIGFGDVNKNVANGFSQAEIANNSRQMANMNQLFGVQTAMMQGFDGVQAQLANCCCENRLATANQTATLLAEHCADRQALSDGIRDIIAKLDSQDLYAERRENENLRQQLAMAQLAASQTAQTAQLIADNAAQTAILRSAVTPATTASAG